MVVAKHATTTQYGAIEEKTQTHPVDDYNLDLLLITLISPLWIIPNRSLGFLCVVRQREIL